MSSSQDVRFSDGAVEEGRKLANKLWNVSRLILANAEGATPDAARPQDARGALDPRPARRSAARGRGRTSARSTSPRSPTRLYHLTFDDFCDWYAEAIKPRLYDGDEDAQATALAALERLLKLLHPVMPHVTEEIWSNLPAPRVAADRRALAGGGRAVRGRRRRARADPGRGRRSSGGAACAAARRRGAADLRGGRQARPGQGERRTSRPRSSGCAGRSRAPRGCSRTSASSPNAPAEVVEARAREARALPAGARCPRAT